MKKLYPIIFSLFFTSLTFSQLSINEVSYYSSPKYVEISGPVGFNLTGWSLNFYKGASRTFISSLNLSGLMPGTPTIPGGNMSLLAIDTPLLDSDNPKGGYVLLINGTTPIQLLAYQGAGAATVGGLSSVDIGSTTSPNSIQLNETGWIAASPTKDQLNIGQTLSVVKNQIEGFSMYPNPVSNGKFSITTNSSSDKHVEIYSLLGKRVFNKIVKPNETIEIYHFNIGLYLLRIEEDGKIATRKLIVN